MLGKIKYVLKKNLNMKTSYVVGLTVLSLFIIVGGLSVALYTSQAESRGSLNIMTGDLISLLEGEELTDNQIRVEENETKRITITLKNKNTKDAKFNLYYTPIEGVEIRSYSGLKPPTEEGIVLKPEEEKTYKVEIHNTKGEVQQITFGSDVGLSTKNLSFPRGKNIIDIGNDPNQEENSLYNIMRSGQIGTDENIDFYHKEEIISGIYLKYDTTENTYPIYFYRGAVENNLIFGKFCWKIVRTTETGGIKLIYNGTPENNTCPGTNATIGNAPFNSITSSPAYVSYMPGEIYPINAIPEEANNAVVYGTDVKWDGSKYILQDTEVSDNYISMGKKKHYTCFSSEESCENVSYVYIYNKDNSFYLSLQNGEKIEDAMEAMYTPKTDSTIKTVIDTWYQQNMLTYTEKLEDTVWCNDKSSEVGSLYFGAVNRIENYPSNQASLDCIEKRDSYTVNKENGNGSLTYPVGMLTIDEVTLAGSGRHNYSENSYLITNGSCYTLTPYALAQSGAREFFWTKDGFSNSWNSVNVAGVRPSISLKVGTIKKKGTGTTDDPYIVE